MRLSPSPDLSAPARLAIVAIVVGAIVCALLLTHNHLTARLGDTDDATRLVIVRDLLSGRGWYDQWIGRLQPPVGVYLHWSRLLDGALAGSIWLLRHFTTPAAAEFTTRLVWPLAWIFPAVAAALVIARNVGGRSAVFLAAPLLALDLQLYRQFIPGRIDHHNIQIVMTIVALACALAPRWRALWATGAGLATGLGLAIGLEALPIQALIGASYALELARDRQGARPAIAYGLSLAASSVGFFLIETPPWRWSMSFCDAIAFNLVGALMVAGAGLALVGVATPRLAAMRAPPWTRTLLLALVGGLALATYLAIAPQCIHGPFAAVDPAIKPFWMNHIQEMQPLPAMLIRERAATLVAILVNVMALASCVYLLARRRPPSTGVSLLVACMVVAAIEGYFAWRLQDYVFWIGIPIVAATASLLAARWLGDRMIPSVLATVILAPAILGGGVDKAWAVMAPAKRHPPNLTGRCSAPAAYAPLAALPPGLVLSETDLGPYILAFTHDSALAAPYHRMSWGILAAHRTLDATPAVAEARMRALGVTYLVDCPVYYMAVSNTGFGSQLRKGEVPPWLTRVSAPNAILQIYALRPAAN